MEQYACKINFRFSSGKLKAIFSKLIACGHSLQNYQQGLADKGELTAVCKTIACCAIDVIASVRFGIDYWSSIQIAISVRMNDVRQIFAPSWEFGMKFSLSLNLLRHRWWAFFVLKYLIPKLSTSFDWWWKKLRLMVKKTSEYHQKSCCSKGLAGSACWRFRNSDQSRWQSLNHLSLLLLVSLSLFIRNELAKNVYVQQRMIESIEF